MKKIVADEIENAVKATTSEKKRASAAKNSTTTTRRRSTKTALAKSSGEEKRSKEVKNPFVFSLNTAESLLEITAKDDVYEIYASSDEYVLFLV